MRRRILLVGIGVLSGLTAAPTLADGIEVLAPARPFYPLGQETEVHYRFTEPWPGSRGSVLVFIHAPGETLDAMGSWVELWNPILGVESDRPAVVGEGRVVRIPITVPNDAPVGENRVISVVAGTSVWGSSEPFEIISHIGEGSDWEVGGRALFMSHPRGGESWQRGRQYSIAWLAHGMGMPESRMPTATFRVDVLRSGRGLIGFQPSGPHFQCTPETLRCIAHFELPEDERFDGNEITVRITAREPGFDDVVVESGPFSIRAGGIMIDRPRGPSPTGEPVGTPIFYISNTEDIRWHLTRDPRELATSLFLIDSRGDTRVVGSGGTFTSGVGHIPWWIGHWTSPYEPGIGYRLRVARYDDLEVWDESVPFALFLPTLAVSIPDRGAGTAGSLGSRSYYPDESVVIEWSGDGFQSPQRFNAWATVTENHCGRPTPVRHFIAEDLPAPGGSTTWDIGSLVRVGGRVGGESWDWTDDCLPIALDVRLELPDFEDQIFAYAPEGFSIERRP